MYERRRNIVHRPDGKRVNVARSRGQLFVCSGGCCCGHTEDGFAPVPADLYHQEWERRRLRNIVHLTLGGCLGPCALANVALLLIDGQTLWFHSLNTPELVLTLYDYIVAMLDADTLLPAPAALAPHQFTATTWQPRPDGAPVDDHRHWQTRRATGSHPPVSPLLHRGDPDREPPCCTGGSPRLVGAGGSPSDTPAATAPAGTAAPDSLGPPIPSIPSNSIPVSPDPAGDTRDPEALVAALRGEAAAPRKNGELVFAEPWEGRAFGMAVALHDQGRFTWEEFRDQLVAAIRAAEAAGGPFVYYACWLAALEAILQEKEILAAPDIEERTSEFEFGERDEVF